MWLAFVVALCAIVVTMVRPPAMPIRSVVAIILGTFVLGVAAGSIGVPLSPRKDVVVMVDRSQSTRTADYRNDSAFRKRLEQLIGDTPNRVIGFSGGVADDRTIFIPPAADAIVLFSDAQFDLPATGPPTYIVVDPNLEHAPDAAVARLEARGDTVVATVHNRGAAAR